MNTQLKTIVASNPAARAEELYQEFKSTFGNYKPVDTCVRVVCAYKRGELDDIELVDSKMAFMYHTETAARMNARRCDKKDPDYSFKVSKANLLSRLINHLEACL